MQTHLKTILAATVAALVMAPTFAGNGNGNGKGGGHAKGHAGVVAADTSVRGHAGDRGNAARHAVVVQQAPVTTVQPLLGPNYGSNACPPGLARKNNGCLPPGQAKQIAIGQRIPSGVQYSYTVPQPVLSTLPAAPLGYRYAVVGNDVVLVNSDTNIISNILRGLLG